MNRRFGTPQGPRSLTRTSASVAESQNLEQWLAAQLQAPTRRPDLIGEGELRRQPARFLDALAMAVADGEVDSLSGAAWDDVRDTPDSRADQRDAIFSDPFNEVPDSRGIGTGALSPIEDELLIFHRADLRDVLHCLHHAAVGAVGIAQGTVAHQD
jgi:hypothetical protein